MMSRARAKYTTALITDAIYPFLTIPIMELLTLQFPSQHTPVHVELIVFLAYA